MRGEWRRGWRPDWMHWAEAAKLLTAPMMHAAARSGRSAVDVQGWIHAFDIATPLTVLEELVAQCDPDAMRAMNMLQSIDQRPERERGTVFSTSARIFSALNEQAVADSAQSSRIDARTLLDSSGTVYLCTARQSPERVAGLFVGLLMTIVSAAYERAERDPDAARRRPLGLFLDELANVVPIDDLPALASQGAGRGVLLMSIVQDVSQLRARYGADRSNSVVNNHVAKVVLPGVSDPETTDLVSRLAGQRRSYDVQTSLTTGAASSRTYVPRTEPLLTADALRRLPRDRAVLLYRGRAPALIRLRPWHRDRRLRALSALPYVRGAEFVASATVRRGLLLRLSKFLGERLHRRPRHAANRQGRNDVQRRPQVDATRGGVLEQFLNTRR
jgi:type IV secretion system protein VirD4